MTKESGEASVIILFRARKKAFFSLAPFRIRASSKREVGGLRRDILAAGCSPVVNWTCAEQPGLQEADRSKVLALAFHLAVLVLCGTGQLPLCSQESQEALFAHNTVFMFRFVFAQTMTVAKHSAFHIYADICVSINSYLTHLASTACARCCVSEEEWDVVPHLYTFHPSCERGSETIVVFSTPLGVEVTQGQSVAS